MPLTTVSLSLSLSCHSKKTFQKSSLYVVFFLVEKGSHLDYTRHKKFIYKTFNQKFFFFVKYLLVNFFVNVDSQAF